MYPPDEPHCWVGRLRTCGVNFASRTHDEFAYASLRVKFSRWVLRCETLIIVIVPV